MTTAVLSRATPDSLAVADVYESLTADRPYRPRLRPEQALATLERDRGTGFDADCLDALVAALESADREAGPAGEPVPRAA